MKTKTVRVTAAVILTLIITFCAGYFLSKPVVYAVGFIKVERDVNVHATTNQILSGYNPYFLQDHIDGVAAFLHSPEIESILEHRSIGAASLARLNGIKPHRGTSLLRIEYRGYDSNHVFNVASNAAFLVEYAYATNHPDILIKHVDAVFWQPQSGWSKLVDRLSGLFE